MKPEYLLTEAIENGIKVNESSIGRKNADASYILMSAMDNEAKERYYYRLVVNRYESNNMGTYYVDDLYAVRAKKRRDIYGRNADKGYS